MKQKSFLVLLAVVGILINIIGIFEDNFWLETSGQALFVLPLATYYYSQLPSKNLNFYALFFCIIATSLAAFFRELWYFNEVIHGLWLIAYIFLAREAIRYIEHKKGSRFTTSYFFTVIAVYAYLLSTHILEIERSLSNNFMLSLYILYYLNILFIAGIALVYYLNSFSKKSVFFICLTLSFIFADVLRDMEVFYFRDLSVELVESLIRFAGLKLVFLFFVTREKKLRLMNLI